LQQRIRKEATAVMMRRRRPLMRAAMVGGTAYAVGKHSQRAGDREEDQEVRLQQLESQQYAQAPVTAPPGRRPDRHRGEADAAQALQDQGVLTPEEFAAAKAKLLGT
jgi:hypothetical protein